MVHSVIMCSNVFTLSQIDPECFIYSMHECMISEIIIIIYAYMVRLLIICLKKNHDIYCISLYTTFPTPSV